MRQLLSNDWFISIASSIVTLFIVAGSNWIQKNIRSLQGVFSGCYLAITTIPRTKQYIIEFVRCNHIRNKLSGRITGVCVINELNVDHLNETKFKFSGKVSERLMMISYWTDQKEANNSGSLTLNGNTEGSIFIGSWAGLENEKVVTSKCTWYKVDKFDPKSDRDLLITLAKERVFEKSGLSLVKGIDFPQY